MVSLEIILDTMALVMYRLLQMGFETASGDEVILLGLLSLCYNIFLQWCDGKLAYLHFPSTYKNCLLDPQLTSSCASQIIIWLLMVGGISIFTASDDRGLKHSLQEHVVICKVKSWGEMRDILKSFKWIDLLHDGPRKHIFDSILTL
jgi:hypothetical protein